MKYLVLICLGLLGGCAQQLEISSTYDPTTGCAMIILHHHHQLKIASFREDDGRPMCRHEWVNPDQEKDVMTLEGRYPVP